MRRLRETFNQLRQYPSAMAGLAIIAVLVLTAVITVIAIPYPRAIDQWRGADEMWIENPANARPAWFNWFRDEDLPETVIARSEDADVTSNSLGGGNRQVEIPLTFEYPYETFPAEINLFFTAKFKDSAPHAQVVWETPDERTIPLGSLSIQEEHRFAVSINPKLLQRFGDRAPEEVLFADPDSDPPRPLPGKYTVRIQSFLFEEGAELQAKSVVYGKVHGMAGTDHRRRPLMVALLWGTPVALVFGLLAAAGTTLTTLFIAAVGVWFGKWVDALIQRITEVNMVLPLLPILIMIGALYSTSIWLMLGVVILLGIFSASIKVYRAMLLPIKEAPYIEAARAYGAGNFRIILRYMLPKILPVLIPSFVTLIPTYVFLEASLAVLGLGDPVLPTWGKVINDARANGALWKGQYYWVVQPAVLLMFTGLGFAMLGFALDRIFNPRLRQI